jgi:hypothetical protein
MIGLDPDGVTVVFLTTTHRDGALSVARHYDALRRGPRHGVVTLTVVSLI